MDALYGFAKVEETFWFVIYTYLKASALFNS